YAMGGLLECAWIMLRLGGEPPMTRFVAKQLAEDHWFDISAAQRDLGYEPIISMQDGLRETIAWLKDKTR
ncbi:MAG: 3-beta hydroxysteroid dehydrogenase, partial [Opitutales bacterium]